MNNFKVTSIFPLLHLLSQNATFQTTTNGQTPLTTTNETVQLKCNYCRGTFSLKPEVLDWEVRPL